LDEPRQTASKYELKVCLDHVNGSEERTVSDIRIVTAPIGGGKSRFAASEICKVLATSERLIVTNVPIILQDAPEGYLTIQEWCDKYVKEPLRTRRRIIVLTAEQTSEFWRYLPRFDGLRKITDDIPGVEFFANTGTTYHDCMGLVLPQKPHPQDHEKGVFVTDFDRLKAHPRFPGIDYYIDEVHVNFSSRSFYQSQGKAQQAEYFMSQVRKLNGNIDLISQHPEKMDKNFRRNVTEWLTVKNMARTPLFMGAGFKGGFRYSRWIQSEQPDKNDPPNESGFFRLDAKEYQKVYFTMAGTGMRGSINATSETNRYKLKSPWIWAIPIVLALLLAFFGPKYIEEFVHAATTGISRGVIGGMEKGMGSVGTVPTNRPAAPVLPPVAPAPVQQGPVRPVYRQRAVGPTSEQVYEASLLYCTGVFIEGTNVSVTLSDGRVADSEFGDVQGVGHAWVKVFGMDPIPIRPAPRLVTPQYRAGLKTTGE
jgi:hypothetical protein